MSTPSLLTRRAEENRQRILDAAVQRFSAKGYDQVGLRQIAGDAGVDVARVHRMFGSKEELFAATVRRAFDRSPADAPDLARLVDRLADLVLSDTPDAEGNPLLMLVRSAADPHASSILRQEAERRFLAPMARMAGTEDGGRAAALLTACCVGLAVLRDVLAIPALADGADPALTEGVKGLLAACLALPPTPLAQPLDLPPPSAAAPARDFQS